MTEATLPRYKVSFTLAYGGKRYARVGPLPEACDDIPSLTDVLDHLSFTDYDVKADPYDAAGYKATASIVVFGRTSANFAHGPACDLRIPVAYAQLPACDCDPLGTHHCADDWTLRRPNSGIVRKAES